MTTNEPHADGDRITRTFRELTDEDAADIQRIAALLSPGMPGGIVWSELLQSDRILIVAEAGAGKTYECQQQQKVLWDAGEPAFLFELATLTQTDPRDMLDGEQEARFDAWLASQSDVATFFLDSIDELKLTLGSFEQALRRFSKVLAGQLGRARIVITTRPIPFDQQTVYRLLPIPDDQEDGTNAEVFADIAMHRERQKPSEKSAPPWRNVGLMPLTDAQIREMAVVQHVADVDGLMADIRQRAAEDFARRPQDLIELCADWNNANRIRSHRDQVVQNIAVKLQPRRRERAPLSADKALDGARRLALAALLTRKLTIRHNAEADKGGPVELALDPTKILRDWSVDERETLLERALFGFASYGRVRFHHRSVIEYLAAEQIDALITKGMSVKAAKRLLFAETAQGDRIVRPSMHPVAAWLAGRRSAFFTEIVGQEPEVLLNFADPQSLDLSQRREALRAYVGRYGEGGWRGLRVPYIQIHRFVSSDLASEVTTLWELGIESPDVRELMLSLIELGPLKPCEPIAVALALAGDTKQNDRFNAIDALIALRSPALNAVVRLMGSCPTIWNDGLVRGLISRLFPDHMTVEQLCPLLRRVKEKQNSVGDLGWQLPRTIAAYPLTLETLESLRACLTVCVLEGLVWRTEWPHLIAARPHLIPALATVCTKQITSGLTTPSILHSIIVTLRLGKDDNVRGEPLARLREAVETLTLGDRETAFWLEDAFLLSLHTPTKPFERLFELTHRGTITPDARDEAWIIRGLSDVTRTLSDRAFLLEVAVRLLRFDDRTWPEHVNGLKQYVADQPELLFEIENHLRPSEVNAEHEKWRRDDERRQIESERKNAKARASWVAFWHEIATNPDKVFTAKRSYNTAWYLWQTMERVGASSRSEGWNRRFIEANFGKETADRLRLALAPIWRKDPPTLSRERKPKQRNTTFLRWQLGLAALAAESEDAAWASKISPKDAEAAARHIPIELNSFPSWTEALVSVHPDVVDRIMGTELTFELEQSARSPHWHSSTLQNIGSASSKVAALFLPRLRDWLDQYGNRRRRTEDVNAAGQRLRRVIEILIQHGDPETVGHIRAMAHQRLRRRGGVYESVWLPVLLRLDPVAGVAALERVLSAIAPNDHETALGWIGSLFGERHHGPLINLTHDGFTPALLLRLVKLSYVHVRLADDVTHDGVFSPGARDHAERGRNAILGALLATSGSAGWAAKLEFASEPMFAHLRDRAITIARERAAEEVDTDILTEAEVAQLNQYGEAPPATFEAMFALLRDRIDDLDELLLEDVSPRENWAAIRDERVMRKEIARELRNRSNHSYTVDQEAATADEKETDIRLRTSASGQQAVIELKIGEKPIGRPRSAAELRRALTDQLVRKYMAADECRAGCLMITSASNQTWSHPETKATMDFSDLIEWLNEEADQIVTRLGGGLRLFVKGLDLRPRLPTEHVARKRSRASPVS